MKVFYYDFSYKRPFTPDDLVLIEKKMTELAKKDFTVERIVMDRKDTINHFKSMKEKYNQKL
jgi:threonyl-tRNA synthetase